MSLAKTRTTSYVTTEFVEAPELAFGVGSVTVTIDWWDAPVLGFSLMLRREMVQSRPDGVVVQKVIEEWDYDGDLVGERQVPMSMRKQIFARVWLPGVNWRERLQLVEESRTTYDYATEFSEGPLRSRTVTAGYVIYDQAAEDWDSSTPTADGSTAGAKLAERGQKSPAGPTRRIPDTARSWRSAINQAAIVEEKEVNQIALWVDPFEEVRDDVELDGQLIRRWRTRHDYLTGLTEVEGPYEERRPGLVGEFPFTVDPPTLEGSSAGASGVRLEVHGGGVTLEQWVGLTAPVKRVAKLAPEKYLIYRRVVERGSRTYTGDAFAIVTTPPAAPDPWPRVDELGIEDFSGAPASGLPPAEPDTEPETPVELEAEAWSQIAEVKNQSPNAVSGEGVAVYFDRDVEDGWKYAYYAVAKVKEELSEESNHVEVTYDGPLSFRSTIGVQVIPGARDITLDITMPPDRLLDALGLPDGDVGYGETLSIDPLHAIVTSADGDTIPIAGDTFGDGNPAAWPAGLLTDALDLGRAIGLRHAMRNRDRDVATLNLAVLPLGLERGQQIGIPAVMWTTTAAGLRAVSRARTADAQWVLEGFEFELHRQDSAIVSVRSRIELEEL